MAARAAGLFSALSMPGGVMGYLATGIARCCPASAVPATGPRAARRHRFPRARRDRAGAVSGAPGVPEHRDHPAADRGAAVLQQVAVQQAQQSLTQAKQQQAQDAITSNDQIQQSEMNLASVTRNTAASQVQALQSVTQAQQGGQQATYGLAEANYNLGPGVRAGAGEHHPAQRPARRLAS